jgi:NTP pyrophosphatase (non-canonical NTP hydrolase)
MTSEVKVSYQKMVKALAKPGFAILESLDSDKCHLLHMAVGVSGEAGELIDAVKKHVIYGKPLDMENIKEELGDLEFYMEGLRGKLGLTRAEILAANMDKLETRYLDMLYSDSAAQARADKAPGE